MFPDCPAFKVRGNTGAVTLKTVAPLTLACEIVRGEPPLLVATIACDEVLVASVLLNVTLVGETDMAAAGADATVTADDDDLLVSATLVALTLYVPAVLGAV